MWRPIGKEAGPCFGKTGRFALWTGEPTGPVEASQARRGVPAGQFEDGRRQAIRMIRREALLVEPEARAVKVSRRKSSGKTRTNSNTHPQ